MSLSPVQIDSLLAAVKPGSTVFLVGAGGCGMCGLGHLLLDQGFVVAGSDLQANSEVFQLQARGAQIFLGHSGEHVEATRPALVAYTSAARSDNPELKLARALGIPTARRAMLLSALLLRQRGICVAGMHGKTTTSAWLAFALGRLGAPLSYAIGWQVPQFDRSARWTPAAPAAQNQQSNVEGQETALNLNQNSHLPFFVIETDESDGTLCQFSPEHALILNVDAEHLDHFAGIEAVCGEFSKFAAQTRGLLVYCADDANLCRLFSTRRHAATYGYHLEAEYRALAPVQLHDPSTNGWVTRFEVQHKGQLLGQFTIRLLGEKNVINATGVIAMLHRLGYAPDKIATVLSQFKGAARRQQELFRDESFRVYEDYGHHPNEIRATLQALKGIGARRILVAFQPHRYTRTYHLLKEFSTCFEGADRLWITDIYPASEPAIPGVTSARLAQAIRDHGQAAEYVVSYEELRDRVRASMQPGDMVLFLGAGGDITEAAHALADDLRSEEKKALLRVATAEVAESLSTATGQPVPPLAIAS